MKLFIPELGTDLTLSKDWTFSLFYERRNSAVWDAFDSVTDNALTKWRESELVRLEALAEKDDNEYFLKNPTIGRWRYDNPYRIDQENINSNVTLPSKTKLRVDRIYIRKGQDAFSSLSFLIMSCPLKHLTASKDGGTFPKYQKRRFWAKLDDVNSIEFTP